MRALYIPFKGLYSTFIPSFPIKKPARGPGPAGEPSEQPEPGAAGSSSGSRPKHGGLGCKPQEGLGFRVSSASVVAAIEP